MLAKLWRMFAAIFKPAAPEPVDSKAAFRAKRAAQRRDQRARKKAREAALIVSPTPSDVSPTVSPTVADIPKEREEEKRERGARIAEDWRPDAENLRLATAAFDDQAEAEIASFHDYWRARAGPGSLRRDFQAQFRWWVRERSKQLVLPLAARPVAVTGDRHETAQARYQSGRGSVAAFGRQRFRQEFTRER